MDLRSPRHVSAPAGAEAEDVVAVILAAGKGTRMRSSLPKVLHLLAGRTLLSYSLGAARAAGFEEIVLVVGYEREAVQTEVGEGCRFVVQEEQRGTGHAVQVALEALQGFSGRILVLNGDMPFIRPASLRRVVSACGGNARGSLLTCVVTEETELGRIVRDGRGRIARIVEATEADEEMQAIQEVNVGVYCFDADCLRSAIGRLSAENTQKEYYLTDVVEILHRRGHTVVAVPAEDPSEARGINTPEELQRENQRLEGRN